MEWLRFQIILYQIIVKEGLEGTIRVFIDNMTICDINEREHETNFGNVQKTD